LSVGTVPKRRKIKRGGVFKVAALLFIFSRQAEKSYLQRFRVLFSNTGERAKICKRCGRAVLADYIKYF